MDRTARWATARGPLVVVGVLVLVTAALLPLSGRVLGQHPAFLPAVFSAVVVLYLLTAWLLLAQYRASGRPRVLLLALAYAWSLLQVVPHVLVFPGVLTAQGLLGAAPSSAPWLWTSWHTGFAVVLALVALPVAALDRVRPEAVRRRDVAVSLSSVLALSAGAVALATAGNAWLPVVISATDYSRLTPTVGPTVLGAGVVALVLAVRHARRSSGLDRWLPVVASAALGDAVLTLFAQARYTTGWYGGRVLSVLGAVVVLLALVRELTRLHARLEASSVRLRHLAETDQLTGLPNRRSVLDSADRLAADGPVVVALVDVDRFKQVNDRLGHSAGDGVLFTVAGRMAGVLRPVDVVGRYGGEEFLVLLGGTPLDAGAQVAERLRAAVAASPVRSAAGPVDVSVSIGVAFLEPGGALPAALAAADAALYRAKAQGRDQVVVAGGGQVPGQRRPVGA